MKAISRFSTSFPLTIILVSLAITAFFAHQFITKSYVESDMTKFLPTDLVSIKANDYYKKNFSYNESLIIGIESPEKGILEPSVLRSIESMVQEIKQLKTVKTFNSKLTGKMETVELAMGLDTDDISSISGLEDAVLDRETGAVVTGSVIKKLKKEAGIPFTDENAELLPGSDSDLVKIIPALRKHVLNDRLFKGNILSEDEKASSIMVPLINKWEYKQRYAILELETAIDPDLLKKRFQGQTSMFPYQVYGKTIDGIQYNDTFIVNHSKKVREELQEHLDDYLSPAYGDYPQLQEFISNEITVASFREIIKITQNKDFFMNPDMLTWDIFVSKTYDFAIEEIDPLSLENLEFQLADVKNIYNLLEIYDKTRQILEKNKNEGMKTYVAGQPVVISVMTRVIDRDMGLLLPIGLLVIIAMLALSFRSVRGVVIPLITVVFSVIWSYGFMAFTGTPITSATSIVPIVLLAVGSAYGIHFLNRYIEDAKSSSDRKTILQHSIRGVGVAILMAGLTTFAGFISLSSSSLLMIRDFSLFAAFGIGVALLLTLTLTPAILCFWKLPKWHETNKKTAKPKKAGIIENALLTWASMVKAYPKRVLAVFIVITVIAGISMKDLRFEGGMIESFQDDNPLKQSDNFINKYLTGTGEINLLFKFRESVNLENPWIQDQLKNRITAFGAAWEAMLKSDIDRKVPALNDFKNNLMQLAEKPASNQNKLLSSIGLMNDILNEEFIVEGVEEETVEASDEDADMNALLSVEADSEEESSLDDLGGLAEIEEDAAKEANSGLFADYSSEQINGLKALNQRLNLPAENWEETGKAIVLIRKNKSSEKGQVMIKNWNLTQDLFAADIKQPYVLHKLENLREELISLKNPKSNVDGKLVNPTGFVMGPVDMVRKTYSVFYHDEKPEFKKIPHVTVDDLGDPTLTDRGIIGVVLNQAQNSNRDAFNGMISPDLKEFQFSVMVKNSLTSFASEYLSEVDQILKKEFPADDPYIESISIGGQVPVNLELTTMIANSQVSSIGQAIILVFLVTFFIFRSALGGLYSLIPLVFTIVANFGMMILLGVKIDTGTVMVASISIGIGVDYTIHFLERFKAQLKVGDPFDQAYFSTIRSSGKAVIINAVSVAAGFLVLLASDMGATQSMGTLMAGTMAYSSLAALTLLPAVIFVTKPKFLGKYSEEKPALEILN